MATGRRILFVAWALGCAGWAGGQNLIVNGDFEAGNVGFDTDYVYSPGDIWLIGLYDVVHDVSDVHPLAQLDHDHTTGAGLLMAANGAWPDLPLVWSQTVTVAPGVRYKFVAWAANWAHGGGWHMAPLEFRINGTAVAFWETTVVGQWFLVSAIWDAGAATTAMITIVDLSVEWDGNDPALDDLWLIMLGDMNCDGELDFSDINPFATAVQDPAGYHAQYANCNILGGDLNGDGSVNLADINPFVTLLSAGPPHGACCYGDDTCAVTTPDGCTGTWVGANTTCEPSPCPPTGACCYDDGSCGVTPEALCTGRWLGVNTTCDSDACGPPMGACCLPDGNCTMMKSARCAVHFGVYHGDYVGCESVSCEPFYCAAGAETCADYVSRVQIGAIDNPSGCETGQYADYTALGPANLLVGMPTPCTVTMGNPVWYNQICSLWIDWNHDFVFDDFGAELIDDVWGVGPYVFNITPPTDALFGPTRMRIRTDADNFGMDPCGVRVRGEVEDYTVNVVTPLGACCWPDGTCTNELQSACGGFWAGLWTQCANNDCQQNGVDDFCDLANGTSQDCNGNGIPDECDIADGASCDCQGDGIPYECQLTPAASRDCNGNGIPDECDIGVQWGGLCETPGIPCFPAETCESDWNHNGLPDSCELCGDFDYDDNVDLDDYWLLSDAYGTCAGDPKYFPPADMDNDGCVTLLDYQAWRMCYLMANGQEFEDPAFPMNGRGSAS